MWSDWRNWFHDWTLALKASRFLDMVGWSILLWSRKTIKCLSLWGGKSLLVKRSKSLRGVLGPKALHCGWPRDKALLHLSNYCWTVMEYENWSINETHQQHQNQDIVYKWALYCLYLYTCWYSFLANPWVIETTPAFLNCTKNHERFNPNPTG